MRPKCEVGREKIQLNRLSGKNQITFRITQYIYMSVFLLHMLLLQRGTNFQKFSKFRNIHTSK